MRLASGLWVTAGAIGAAGLWLRVAPPPLPRVDAWPAASPSWTPLPAAESRPPEPSYQPIVTANVFSPSRTAPRVRFVPAGAGLAVSRAVAPTGRTALALRLYGITLSAAGASALIDADPRIPGAEIYRIGDLVAGARLVAINDSSVTLAEPSGPLVLRLYRTPEGGRRP